MTEPTEEVIQETIEKVDGRTTEGKILARLEGLERTQGLILQTLEEHRKRIDDCSIRR